MAAIRSLDELPNPNWSDVVTSLDDTKLHPGQKYTTLVFDDDNSLIVYYTEAGYLVTGTQSGDTDYFILTDPSLGDEPERIWCAGDVMYRPRKALVGDVVAMQAVKHYYQTGQRDTTLHWELDSECLSGG
jgi:hypothetical protein